MVNSPTTQVSRYCKYRYKNTTKKLQFLYRQLKKFFIKMNIYFPNIFGPNEDQPLDKEGALEAFTKFTQEVNDYIASQPDGKDKKPYTVMDLALGFVQVANESMCRPIRNLTEAQGHDTSKHVLACFGGAGGQHACAMARSLGMSTVFVHRYAGILSAYGIALADIVHEAQEPCTHPYEPESFQYLDERIDMLKERCREELIREGLSKDCISTEVFLNLRYDRTDCALMCNAIEDKSKNSCRHGNFEKSFLERYQREFGFDIPGRKIYVDDIRVRGVGKSSVNIRGPDNNPSGPPKPKKVTQCYFEDGLEDTSVYFLEEIASGYDIQGPAIIIDKTSTILVEPHCTACVTKEGDVRIEIGLHKHKSNIGTELDRIQLAIFSHRFMSTAEQMGRVLQRTSISTNIKERLDFSCAMFGPDGGLVANAPHIPVHLGSMQETVQYQIRNLGNDIKEGDVILTNHPVAGGTHLPDLTVITPVFYKGEPKPVFYVASRGHHADIGGLAPVMRMDESATEQRTDEAFRKCERRGRRGACTNAELPPTEKLQEMLQNLKITDKELENSKSGPEKGSGT
ncbi:5-oxoprolinase [Exaiptasia diaphana]|nr:5-oxoprolinase [Exaiptasia diaphana]